MKGKSSFRWTMIALLLVVSLVLPWAVFADLVVNDIDNSIDDEPESRTIAAGSFTVVGFRPRPQDDADPVGGCNCTGSYPATLTITPPTGVTVNPQQLTFTNCDDWKNATFSSNTAGTYTINNFGMSGGRPGGTFNFANADFILYVTAPADTTPPVISYSIVGTLGNNGWYVSNVFVDWTVSDPESAVTIDSGCVDTTINYDTTGATLNCVAHSAGGSSSQSVTIKRDATAPTISASVSPARPASGWWNIESGAPTVSFSCSDATSGIASCPAPHTFPEGEDQSHSGTAYDNAGNSASAGVSDIDVDLTAPTFSDCPAGGPFYLNTGLQPVGPIWADDLLSGLNAGASTLSGSVDTGSIGSKNVGFTAYDYAGNSATKTCTYNVIFRWTGFFQPVDNPDIRNVAKAGSAIPLKFNLDGYQGLGIFDPGYPKVSLYTCPSSNGNEVQIEETVNAGQSSLTYDFEAQQYVYVWKTQKSWAGKCGTLQVKLIDGTEHIAYFKFK